MHEPILSTQLRKLMQKAGPGYALADPEWVNDFTKLIVYDFLNELTNDQSLGTARVETIRRLAEKWGVAR